MLMACLQMWKLKFADVDPKLTVGQMIRQVNQALEAAEMGATIQRLVPLWCVHTPVDCTRV